MIYLHALTFREDGAGDKKKPIFSRLTGKGKDAASAGSSPHNSAAPLVSPKHNQSGKKLFSFGKKSTNSASGKYSSPASGKLK